jgi:hypothetical protein
MIAPGVDVSIATLRLDPDCSAATTAEVISTLTNCLYGSTATGIVPATVEEMLGNASLAPAKLSFHVPVTNSTWRFAAAVVLMT